MSPDDWIKLLYLYGPMALFAFMVFVLLAKARSTDGLTTEQQKIQNLAYLVVWLSIFALGAIIVVIWWRINLPREFEIRGMIHNLQDPETISTRDNLFLKRVYKAASDIDYEWRILSDSPPREPVEFMLQTDPKSTEATTYKIPVSDQLYRGTVEISYDRVTKKMILVDGTYHATMEPKTSKVASIPRVEGEVFNVVHAYTTASPNELVKALDSNDPIIRQNAKRDLISLGHYGLKALDKALENTSNSGRLRTEALSVLERIVGPSEIKKSGWHPVELSSNSNLGIFVLGRDGGVAKISFDSAGPHVQDVFKIPKAYDASSMAVADDAVYLIARTEAGCIAFRYLSTTKHLSRKFIMDFECTSIASDGKEFYIGGGSTSEIRFWAGWDASSRGILSWSDDHEIGALHFDAVGNRLLVGDSTTGSLYAYSLPNFKKAWISSNLGWINSLTSDNSNIFAASGRKVLFLDRVNGSGQNPPPGLRALKAGNISGVALDVTGSVWVSDYDRNSIIGPIPLE